MGSRWGPATFQKAPLRETAARALAAGDDVTLVAQAGAGHFEQVNPASVEWGEVERWTVTLARAERTS